MAFTAGEALEPKRLPRPNGSCQTRELELIADIVCGEALVAVDVERILNEIATVESSIESVFAQV